MIHYKPIDFNPFKDNEFLYCLPSTEAQREIFATIIMEPDASCAFNESLSIDFQGELNQPALKTAIQQILLRHDALRTTFIPDGSMFMVSKQSECLLSEFDLSQMSSIQQQSKVQELITEEVELAFDLIHGPLIRFKLLKLSTQHHILILTGHHIVCDGWSTAVLIEDMGHLYNLHHSNATATQATEIKKLPNAYSFSQYARLKQEQKNSLEYKKSEQYWLQQFLDSKQPEPITISNLDLPTDFTRPLQRSYHSARLDYELPLPLIEQITHFGAQQGCSLVNTLFAGFNLLIHTLSQEKQFVVGMPAAEQSILGEYYLIGHCVNMLPIKTQIDPQQSFIDYLKLVKRNMLDAYEHQNYTFGSSPYNAIPVEFH